VAETLTAVERAIVQLMADGGDGEIPPLLSQPLAKLLRCYDAALARAEEAESRACCKRCLRD
jgi:hypothetical protein